MKEIDDIFKKSGQGPGFEYHEEFWNNMEKTLDERKRRTPFPFLITVVLLSIAFVSGIIVYLQDNKLTKNNHYPSKTTVANRYDNNESRALAETAINRTTDSSEKYTFDRKLIAKQSSSTANYFKNKQPENPAMNEVVFIEKESVIFEKPVENPENIGEYIFEPLPVPDTRRGIYSQPLAKYFNLPFDVLKKLIFTFAASPNKPETANDSDGNMNKWEILAGLHFNANQLNFNVPDPIKNMESNPGSWRGGIAIQANKNKWILMSGLSFQVVKFQTNYLKNISYLTYDTSFVMVNPNYGTTPHGYRLALVKKVIDSSIVIENQILHPNNQSKLQYLQIPLLGGYRIKKDKLSWQILAGVNVGIPVNATGYYPVVKANQFEYVNNRKQMNLNPLVIGLDLRTGLQYQMHKNFSLYTQAIYNQSLNSLNKLYHRTYKNTGIEIGVLYKFNTGK